jgi:hypothetical protein
MAKDYKETKTIKYPAMIWLGVHPGFACEVEWRNTQRQT